MQAERIVMMGVRSGEEEEEECGEEGCGDTGQFEDETQRGDEGMREPLTLRGETVEEVEDFKYLGSLLANDGTDERDIVARVNKAWGAFHSLKKGVWKQRGMSLEFKIKVYNRYVIPKLLYGCESWALTARLESKLEVAQIRMLRSILRVRWDDFVDNDTIRQRAGVREVRELVRRARLRWFGHVVNMESHRWPRVVMCGVLADCDSRPAGGQAAKWRLRVKKDLQELGVWRTDCIKLPGEPITWTDIVRGKKYNRSSRSRRGGK